MPNPKRLLETLYGAKDGAVRMQDGGDPVEQMFNFNPMAAQAMRQERMRREAEEAKRYKSVMGTTPQDLLRRVEPPPAEMSALPLSKTPTTLDRLARSGLEALGVPKPRAQSITSNVKGAVEMLVPDPERIYREMSEATEERDPAKFALANLEAGLGYMPFAKPAIGAAKAIGSTALDVGKAAGREALRPIDQAMFGEGPLAGVLNYAAPLQAAPKMQAPVSPLGFYNPVEKAALNVQRKQGPGQAFLNELQRGENVSKDFLQSSGLAERLAAMPNVTREEVQAMTKGTVPEVQQVVLGETVVPPHAKEWLKVHMPEFDPSDVSQIDEAIALANQRYDKLVNEGDLGLAEFAADAIDDLMEMKKQYKPGTKAAEALSKYGQYTIPGGENYREMLLTLPTSQPTDRDGLAQLLYGRSFDDLDVNQAARVMNELSSPTDGKTYRSTHWSQPNVLSHIRMNDRTDAEGKKVLFIEELQSDWAQEGRKKGFKQSQRSYGDIQKEIDELLAKQRQVSNDALRLPNLDDSKFDAMTEEVRNLGRQVDDLLAEQKNIQEAIPSAPFVQNTKDWVDLSLKNILKRAVDEGYDRVAFINGKQSADRFRLSNHVSSIEWNPPGDRLQQKGADGFVTIYLQNNNPVELPLTREGKVLEGIGTQFDGKDLDEIVGKEVAQKIMASPSGSLAGEGLSIGGTGMKKFYDEIVPDRIRKVIGKESSLRDIQFEDKTAKLREELASATPGSSRYLYLTDKIGQLERDAERYGALGNQLGFDITPEIREKFSKPIPYKKGGAVSISDNPDVMALEVTMAGGGAARKALETMAKQAEKRGLVRDPRFKMAPGSAENLAGKSYAQWAAEQQYKHELEDALAKLSGVPGKSMSIQDVPVGSRLISIIGDRTQADKVLKSVNETPLVNEVYLFGGPRFGQGKLAQGKEEFWASQAGAAQAVQNRAEAAAERAKGKPVIGVYTAMGAKDSDMYAKHFAEALIEQYPYMSMTNKQIDGFNKQFRKQYPKFAGIDSPEFVDQIMNNSDMRKAFVTEHLKKKNIKDFGIPDGLATRHAITVPELRDVPSGLAGYSMGELKPGEVLQKGSYIEHPTYNTVIPGRYMGGLEIMQDYRDLFPDATQRMLETLKNNPKFQGPGGKNPESQLFGTFGFQGAEQEVTQKLIDELAAREELIKKLGVLPYKKGGKVKKVKVSKNPDVMRLELLRKKHA